MNMKNKQSRSKQKFEKIPLDILNQDNIAKKINEESAEYLEIEKHANFFKSINNDIIPYDFFSIEKHWVNVWDKSNIYKTHEISEEHEISDNIKKFYLLDTFVYPSGKGVTIGHYKSFGGMDVIARYKRMNGFNVLYPTGWDTFGLPAENFAIKSGRHPKDITDENISNYRYQYKSAGISYNWDREINTSDPSYYRWTQWLFLLLFKKGLAYKAKSFVNYCNNCKTVVSREQIINDNECERCGNKIIQKELDQWFFKVSVYKDRLIEDCSKLNWEQRNINPHKKWLEDVHDWCISRQRYWGPPIPMVYCQNCGMVPVPEKDLPVKLPYDINYNPTGKALLSENEDFVNTVCPNCNGIAKREVDTMDTFVSSAWYMFRFIDPYNGKEFANINKLKYQGPIDHYSGTIEHLTAHLVYARFITKVLSDNKLIPFDEPFPKYTPVGLLVDKLGTKFSKRLGNAPDTNELIKEYGGDLLRLSCFYISPYQDISKWSREDIVGVKRFRDKIWTTFKVKVDGNIYEVSEQTQKKINQLIKTVGESIEQMKYNVAISHLIVFLNYLNFESPKSISIKASDNFVDKNIWEIFIRLLAPFAPFISEQIWSEMGNKESIHIQKWPEYPGYDANLIKEDNIVISIQINGKFKKTITVSNQLNQDQIEIESKKIDSIGKVLRDKQYEVIFIKNKIINFILQQISSIKFMEIKYIKNN